MIKFFMILAWGALIAAMVFAGLNNASLNKQVRDIEELKTQYTRLNSDLQEAEERSNNADVVLEAARTDNQKVKAGLSLANDELTRKNGQLRDLTAKFDGMKSKLEELELLKKQMNGRNIADVKRELTDKEGQLQNLKSQNTQLENEILAIQGDLEDREQQISTLEQKELERRQKVALNAMEAMVIAINRDYGFVIVNAGSDVGITPDSSLLVQRDVDRIGRLRIVSVEPSVTVADIIPGSVSPGAQIMVRDKVIFEQVQ